MKKRYLCWIIAFVCMMIMPAISYPLFRSLFHKTENIENAAETHRPFLTADTFRSFPDDYETYYNAHLPFRSQMITANAALDYFVFKDSSSENVIIGKDGWLFFREDLPDYQRENLYDEDMLKEIDENLTAIRQYLTDRNIEFIIFIAPNKTSVYGEDYLPTYIRAGSGLSRMELLANHMAAKANATMLFPLKTLSDFARKYPDFPCYFHRDTHWNRLGAYIGTNELLRELGRQLPPVSEVDLVQTNDLLFEWIGRDLSNFLGLSNILIDDVNFEVSNYTQTQSHYSADLQSDPDAYSSYIRASSDATDTRKVCFIRDSFGSEMLPYLSACFSDIYSPHKDYMTEERFYEMIDAERPDIVILEYVERQEWAFISLENWR